MRSCALFFICCFTLLLQEHSCVNLNTLRLVQVVYRHGDRAPLATYPTDPYQDIDKYWPLGLGQLTSRGKDQQYELGAYLRQRYHGFISPLYNRKQIHVLSSDTDRTLMSAEANMAGLFPKLTAFQNDKVYLNEDGGKGKVDMQLVPIHTLMKETDKILHMSARCPRRDIAFTEYEDTSPEFDRIRQENHNLFTFLKEKTGLSRARDIFTFTSISDVLYCQQQHNLTLPSWANSTVLSKLRQLNGISFAMKGGTAELRRLFGGPLLRRLMNNMHALKISSRSPKMYMHSAHDDTLSAILTAIGVFDPQCPSYASMFIMELHQEESTGKSFVNIYYRNDTQHEPYPLEVPGCGSPCYLQDMKTVLSPFIPEDWEAECQTSRLKDQPIMFYQFNMTSFMYFLVVIIISVTIWGAILCLASKRKPFGINNRLDTFNSDFPVLDKNSYIKMP